MLPLDVSTTDDNSVLLSELSSGSLLFNAERMRDTYAADLVTLVRPYHQGAAQEYCNRSDPIVYFHSA